MTRHALRIAAATLALALPLAGAAACGTEKKRTVSQELASAQSFLLDSKSVSFTLRLADNKGALAKLMTDEGTSPVLAKALAGGSISYTVDAAGDAALRGAGAGLSATDLKASLKKVNVAVVVRGDQADLFQLRLVDGDLYAQVNLTELGRLAKAEGKGDFEGTLDEQAKALDSRLAQGLKDLRAGKWIKLPLSEYVDQLKELAGAVVPGGIPTPSAAPDSDLGRKLFDAVRPHVTVTDANDSSADRVLDVRVKARPALKAVLGVLKVDKSLPFGTLLGSLTPAKIDSKLADGEAKGTLHLKDGHLTQVAIDVESLRLLSTEPGTKSVAGLQVILEIDDSADAVQAPTDLSSLDLGKLLTEFLEAFNGTGSLRS